MRINKSHPHHRRDRRRRRALLPTTSINGAKTIESNPSNLKRVERHIHLRQSIKQRAYQRRHADIARQTLSTLSGEHTYADDDAGQVHDLSSSLLYSCDATSFYPHYSQLLADWEAGPSLLAASSSAVASTSTQIKFVPSSSLSAAYQLCKSESSMGTDRSIGILSSAYPRRPGGAFLNGSDEPDSRLVRQSTLYHTLQKTNAGAQFYAAHKKDAQGCGLHSHAMLYVPEVAVFKDDNGRHIAPYHVNVVLSVPVNAGSVRSGFNISEDEFSQGVRTVMKERMARALRLFEERGNRVLVLGAFGVGQFRNSPDMIGEIWADLLNVRGAKFKDIFEKVIFAVPGKHLHAVENAFLSRTVESEMSAE